MEQNKPQIPAIGTETAVHYLMQLNQKIQEDGVKVMTLLKAVEEIMELDDEKVNAVLDKHGIKKQPQQ